MLPNNRMTVFNSSKTTLYTVCLSTSELGKRELPIKPGERKRIEDFFSMDKSSGLKMPRYFKLVVKSGKLKHKRDFVEINTFIALLEPGLCYPPFSFTKNRGGDVSPLNEQLSDEIRITQYKTGVKVPRYSVYFNEDDDPLAKEATTSMITCVSDMVMGMIKYNRENFPDYRYSGDGKDFVLCYHSYVTENGFIRYDQALDALKHIFG